jgi:Holliday junction resolvasome RuvABC endonuclease subunit
MPLHYTNNETITMVAIDPGLNTTGVAVYILDSRTYKPTSIEAFTLVSDKLYNYTGLDDECYTERQVKLEKIYLKLMNIYSYYRPSIVIYEAPFINFRRPMAYGALLEVVSTIKSSVMHHDPNIQTHGVEPLLVKKTVGASLTSNKGDVKSGISQIPILTSAILNNFNHLDEHSIDAIAVGYTFLKTTLKEFYHVY